MQINVNLQQNTVCVKQPIIPTPKTFTAALLVMPVPFKMSGLHPTCLFTRLEESSLVNKQVGLHLSSIIRILYHGTVCIIIHGVRVFCTGIIGGDLTYLTEV